MRSIPALLGLMTFLGCNVDVPGITRVDDDGDGYLVAEDCDDDDVLVNPSMYEICNGVDDNCNGVPDDGVTAGGFYDADSDGFGDPSQPISGCELPAGYVANSGDCDDADTGVHPTASEVCDGIDNDCDGTVDVGAADAQTGYTDADADGYGAPDGEVRTCDLTGLASSGTDCDDTRGDVHPDASEACDEVDNDCDGTVDEAEDRRGWADADGDGFGDPATEVTGCDVPPGYVNNDGDCNDEASGINPAADERCDTLDNDCDGSVDEEDAVDATTWYVDGDGDGYGGDSSRVQCDDATGYVANTDDCRDTSADVYPGAPELCNTRDDDCDGSVDEDALDAPSWYLDADADGCGTPIGAVVSCAPPTGYVTNAVDCDDADGSTIRCDSCLQIQENGFAGSDGTYTIRPDGTDYTVYCSFGWDGGGWTMIAANAWAGLWTEAAVDNGTVFGSGGTDFLSSAFNDVRFTDVLFTNNVIWGQYDGVGDGTLSWHQFQNSIPSNNCGATDGYVWPMSSGTLTGPYLCDTNLYVNIIDLDGTRECGVGDDEEGHGPGWSTVRDAACPFDDPGWSSFISNPYGQLPFGPTHPLYFWVR